MATSSPSASRCPEVAAFEIEWTFQKCKPLVVEVK
jgi:hypothetical protein